MKTPGLIFLCLLWAFTLHAQQEGPLMQSRLESLRASGADASNIHQADPEQDFLLDLNTDDPNLFYNVPFLSMEQANALINHRLRFGALLAPEELQVVPGFDTAFIRNWRSHFYCSRPAIDQSLFSGLRQEVLLRSRRVLQNREGFSNDSVYPYYLGDAWQAYFRYRITAGTRFSAGVTMEKDEGETWSDARRLPADFRSWHVFIRPGRIIQTLAIGDYQVQFGQGLVAWSGLSFGKSAEVFQVFRRGQGFRPYASPGEAGFMRGAAISAVRGRWQADAWFSRRRLDASLRDADAGMPMVSSILESGLHRNGSERDKQGRVVQTGSGFHLQYSHNALRIEALTHYEQFSLPLWPGDDAYERFDPAGRRFLNNSLSVRYSWRNLSFYTETAVDKQGDRAALAGVLLMPDPRVTLMALMRDYARDYQCISCFALAEGSRVQNERAWMAGWIIQPVKNHRIQGYVDRFAFPWLRYRVNQPSSGTEFLLQWVHTPSRTTELLLRYRMQQRGEKGAGSPPAVVGDAQNQQNIRFHLGWMPDKNWEMQTRLEYLTLQDAEARQKGWMLYQEVRFRPMGKAYSFVARYALFATGGYDSRVYAYEQDMPGTFSMPAVDGLGRRAYMMLRYRIRKGTDLWFRYAVAWSTEAGPEEPPRRDEFKLQLRVQF